MKFSRNLASILLSLPLLLVQPLRNAEYGFQPVPYIKTFFRGHRPIYAIHPNTLFLPRMMVCNQVILLPAVRQVMLQVWSSGPLLSSMPSGLDGTTSFSTQASKETNH